MFTNAVSRKWNDHSQMVFENSQYLVQALKVFAPWNCLGKSCTDKVKFSFYEELGGILVWASLVFCGLGCFCLICFGILSFLASGDAGVDSQPCSSDALGFSHVNPAAFLQQAGVPDFSFLSVVQVSARIICVPCKAEGKRYLVL